MKWTTRSHLHLDRTASAWLLRAFVDPDAEFVFLDWQTGPDQADPHSFGMPGVALSSHDEHGTCFVKILVAYELTDDPALMALERGIAAGVRQALELPAAADETAVEAGLGATLDRLGVGLGLLHADDHQHLAAASPLYYALYQAFRASTVEMDGAPADRLDQITFVRQQLGITPSTTA